MEETVTISRSTYDSLTVRHLKLNDRINKGTIVYANRISAACYEYSIISEDEAIQLLIEEKDALSKEKDKYYEFWRKNKKDWEEKWSNYEKTISQLKETIEQNNSEINKLKHGKPKKSLLDRIFLR